MGPALLFSLFNSTQTPQCLLAHIFLLGHEKSADRYFVKASGYSVTIQSVDIRSLPLLAGRPANTASNLLRFHLPELLSRGTERAVWMDVDMLVGCDVCRLVDRTFKALPQRGIAAVPRSDNLPLSHFLSEKKIRKLGFGSARADRMARARAFNAGMIVLNLRLWRESNTTERISALLRKLAHIGASRYRGQTPYGDLRVDMFEELAYEPEPAIR